MQAAEPLTFGHDAHGTDRFWIGPNAWRDPIALVSYRQSASVKRAEDHARLLSSAPELRTAAALALDLISDDHPAAPILRAALERADGK